MKIKQVVVSEGGKELLSGKDGVIVQGCIFASEINENGVPYGGLVGDGPAMEAMEKADVPFRAFSWQELLQALQIPPQELHAYMQHSTPTPRGNGPSLGGPGQQR
jgi:hypothetical protein